jgi:hypothetical protein
MRSAVEAWNARQKMAMPQRVTPARGVPVEVARRRISGACVYALERLENRTFLSAASHSGGGVAAHPPVASPSGPGTVSSWYAHPIAISHSLGTAGAHALGAAVPQSGTTTPDQMRGAYGLGPYGSSNIVFGGVQGDGSGQTIAIIDAYDDPGAFTDLNTFSLAFGLPTFATPANPIAGKPTFSKVNESGGSTLPGGDATHGWDVEASLDIEWAHVMAPKANIMLVEATTNGWGDLIQSAVGWASTAPGVSVVSMSFGGGEFSYENSATWGYDKYFTTPANHNGVTFLAATGDSGSPGAYPAYSPNVVAVGGTSIHVNPNNSWSAENGWVSGGGGVSAYESQPAYQTGKVSGTSSTKRTIPDVSIEADPATGVAICDSTAYGAATPWLSGYIEGGTSLATPMWAGLIAVADQGRSLAGKGTLDGRTQTLPALYSLSSVDYHDITTDTAGNPLPAGYDLMTGLGSPVANQLIPDLVAPGPHLVSTVIGNGTAQRSAFNSVTVTFDAAVNLNPGAITLSQLVTDSTGAILSSIDVTAGITVTNPLGDSKTWVVQVLAQGTLDNGYGDFTDGVYQLTIHAASVTNGSGVTLSGGNRVQSFLKLYGDINGDGVVGTIDFGSFRNTYGLSSTDAGYSGGFDVNHDKTIGPADFGRFRANYGKMLYLPA